MSEPLYDVVIFEVESRKVDAVVGKNMKRDSGHYNAERRLMTVLGRINDRYDADVVEAGKYKKGDTLP